MRMSFEHFEDEACGGCDTVRGGSFVVISSCFGAEGAGEVTEVALRVFTVSEYVPLSC